MHLFLLQLFSVIVLLSRVYIGINNVNQLIVGGLFGLFEGVLLHFLLYFILINYSSQIESWRIFTLAGLQNTVATKKETDDEMYKILWTTRHDFYIMPRKDFMKSLRAKFAKKKIHIQ
jgi:hypothetical protein